MQHKGTRGCRLKLGIGLFCLMRLSKSWFIFISSLIKQYMTGSCSYPQKAARLVLPNGAAHRDGCKLALEFVSLWDQTKGIVRPLVLVIHPCFIVNQGKIKDSLTYIAKLYWLLFLIIDIILEYLYIAYIAYIIKLLLFYYRCGPE